MESDNVELTFHRDCGDNNKIPHTEKDSLEAIQFMKNKRNIENWYSDNLSSTIVNIANKHEQINVRLQNTSITDILAGIRFDAREDGIGSLHGEDLFASCNPKHYDYGLTDIDPNLREDVPPHPHLKPGNNEIANALFEDDKRKGSVWKDNVVRYNNPFDPRISFQGLQFGQSPKHHHYGNKEPFLWYPDAFNSFLDIVNPAGFANTYLNKYQQFLRDLRNESKQLVNTDLLKDKTQLIDKVESKLHTNEEKVQHAPSFVGNECENVDMWSQITATSRFWSEEYTCELTSSLKDDDYTKSVLVALFSKSTEDLQCHSIKQDAHTNTTETGANGVTDTGLESGMSTMRVDTREQISKLNHSPAKRSRILSRIISLDDSMTSIALSKENECLNQNKKDSINRSSISIEVGDSTVTECHYVDVQNQDDRTKDNKLPETVWAASDAGDFTVDSDKLSNLDPKTSSTSFVCHSFNPWSTASVECLENTQASTQTSMFWSHQQRCHYEIQQQQKQLQQHQLQQLPQNQQQQQQWQQQKQQQGQNNQQQQPHRPQNQHQLFTEHQQQLKQQQHLQTNPYQRHKQSQQQQLFVQHTEQQQTTQPQQHQQQQKLRVQQPGQQHKFQQQQSLQQQKLHQPQHNIEQQQQKLQQQPQSQQKVQQQQLQQQVKQKQQQQQQKLQQQQPQQQHNLQQQQLHQHQQKLQQQNSQQQHKLQQQQQKLQQQQLPRQTKEQQSQPRQHQQQKFQQQQQQQSQQQPQVHYNQQHWTFPQQYDGSNNQGNKRKYDHLHCSSNQEHWTGIQPEYEQAHAAALHNGDHQDMLFDRQHHETNDQQAQYYTHNNGQPVYQTNAYYPSVHPQYATPAYMNGGQGSTNQVRTADQLNIGLKSAYPSASVNWQAQQGSHYESQPFNCPTAYYPPPGTTENGQVLNLNFVHRKPEHHDMKFDDEVWYINGVPHQHAKPLQQPVNDHIVYNSNLNVWPPNYNWNASLQNVAPSQYVTTESHQSKPGNMSELADTNFTHQIYRSHQPMQDVKHNINNNNDVGEKLYKNDPRDYCAIAEFDTALESCSSDSLTSTRSNHSLFRMSDAITVSSRESCPSETPDSWSEYSDTEEEVGQIVIDKTRGNSAIGRMNIDYPEVCLPFHDSVDDGNGSSRITDSEEMIGRHIKVLSGRSNGNRERVKPQRKSRNLRTSHLINII